MLDRVVGHRVDAQVTAREVLDERHAEPHVIRPARVGVGALAAEGGDLDVRVRAAAGHDDLGGAGTIMNLPQGTTTATIESKTNFFAAINVGDTARAECTPLHKGRTTMVWQTRITRASDGRLAAIVTQTQLVIPGKFGK